MRSTSVVAAVVAAFAVSACASMGGPDVKRTDVTAPPKPPGCGLEVLRKRPARPFAALGTVTSHLTSPPKDPLSVVTPKACELGADAIIVDQNMVLNEQGHVLVSVTAIRWTGEAPPEPEPPPAAPPETQPKPAAPAAPPAPIIPREPKM